MSVLGSFAWVQLCMARETLNPQQAVWHSLVYIPAIYCMTAGSGFMFAVVNLSGPICRHKAQAATVVCRHTVCCVARRWSV